MGVKGLFSFLCERMEHLQESLIKEELVIDGYNLVGTLYTESSCSRMEGGEYPAFYEHVRRYFQQLVCCGIKPIVVCDGPVGKNISSEEYIRKQRDKLEVIRKLKENTTEGIEIFSRQVFIDAIESVIHETSPSCIRIFYADGDGDSEIVALANGYQCPVLSNDADFFMFELRRGFVTSKYFRLTETTAFGKIFFPLQSFSDGSIGLNLKPDRRFMIPAIKGNDFLQKLDIDYQGHKLVKIDEIVQIFHYYSIEDFPCDPNIKDKLQLQLTENFEKAKCYYKGVKDMKLEEAVSSLKLPDWVLHSYKIGHFHRQMIQILMEKRCTLPITVEDMKKPSCHEASLDIRRFIQGTLVGREGIKELVRDNDNTVRLKRPPPHHQQWPDLDKQSPDERRGTLCNVLDYDQQTLKELEPQWQMVVAASNFWLRKIEQERKQKLAQALVSCFIYCQKKNTYELPPLSMKPIRHQLPLIHCFSQWQSVYYFTVMLNQLLLEPFQYTSPGLIFDGKKALYFAVLYINEKRNEKDVFTQHAEDLELHKKLYRLIMKNQEVCQEEKVTIQDRTRPTVQTTNRFAGLMDCSD